MRGNITIREIILVIACLIMGFFLYRGFSTPIDKSKYVSKEMFDASQDSFHLSRNSFGQQEAKTQLLYGTISDLTKLGSSKDSSIKKLIALVNKKTISATVLSTSTSSTVSSATTIVPRDSVKKDSLVYIYPKYEFNKGDTLKNKWEQIYMYATRDSFHLNYRVHNEFDITQRFEKQKVKGKWFKQEIPMVKVLNLNPNTTVKEFKSFAVQPPKKKQGKAFVEGGIAVIVLEIILKGVLHL